MWMNKGFLKKTLNFSIKVIISIGIAIGFALWVEKQGVKLIPPKDYFKVVELKYIFLYTLLLFAVHFFRAYRWYFLLKPLNPSISSLRTVLISFVGFLAIMVLPLRMGEFARPYFISTTGDVSGSSSLGTIVIERIVDGLLLALILTVSLLLLPKGDYPPWVNYIGWLTLLVFILSLVVVIVMVIYSDKFINATKKAFFFLPQRLIDRIVRILKGFIEGLTTLPKKGALVPFMVYTIVYWGINGISMWLLAKGCGINLPFIAGFTVMSILGVGILLPTGPGLFGNFQAGIYFGFILYLPEAVIQKNGSVYIFIIYFIQLALTVILGVGSMFTSHISFKKVPPTLNKS